MYILKSSSDMVSLVILFFSVSNVYFPKHFFDSLGLLNNGFEKMSISALRGYVTLTGYKTFISEIKRLFYKEQM